MKQINYAVILAFFFCVTHLDGYQSYQEQELDQLVRHFDHRDFLQEKNKHNALCRALHHPMFNEETLASDEERGFLVISLGSNCRPALFTRNYKMRPYALPFDWCITSYQTLCSFIKNDFESFLKRESLVFASVANDYLKSFLNEIGLIRDIASPACVLDRVSGMLFLHDFNHNSSAGIDQQYEFVYRKYMRRIERFYTVMNSGKYIYFIRCLGMKKIEACELCELIKYKFPNTNFTLIVIGNNQAEFERDWDIPHIKNFFIDDPYEFTILTPFWVKLYNNILSGALQ